VSRRNPKVKFDWKRGRHQKHASAEVRDWDRRTACPEPPPWMDDETALKLMQLRREVDPLQ